MGCINSSHVDMAYKGVLAAQQISEFIVKVLDHDFKGDDEKQKMREWLTRIDNFDMYTKDQQKFIKHQIHQFVIDMKDLPEIPDLKLENPSATDKL